MEEHVLIQMGFATKAIHGGHKKDFYGALASPIYQTSTFVFDSVEQGGRRFAGEEGYIYSRLGNPTNTELEEKIAMLEGTEASTSTGSGMGAISSVFWTVLKAGDHVVSSNTLYGCTFALLSYGLTRFGVEVTFVDTTDHENVRKAMKSNTRVVYLETPANPTLAITDLQAVVDIAHENKNCLVIVDNTFCTPYIQRPAEFGADVIVHSATKFLNGHGDVIAGFVAGRQDFIKQVRFFGVKDMTGSVLSPFNAFLITRGLKTLEIRMQKHCSNAEIVAGFLENHPAVERVYYPGLKSFPQFELTKKQMNLSGAIISFKIRGGLEDGSRVMNHVKLASLAVSLGDAETLIQHPASMTHSPYTKEERERSGISDNLIRLAVGLESVDDIIQDLDQALNVIR